MTEKRPLKDLLKEIRENPPPPPAPLEFQFMDTSEGIPLIIENGHVRGATPVELYFRNRYKPESEDEPPLRTAERAIVRVLIDSGLAENGQSQVTHVDRFEIATDDLIIRVELQKP